MSWLPSRDAKKPRTPTILVINLDQTAVANEMKPQPFSLSLLLCSTCPRRSEVARPVLCKSSRVMDKIVCPWCQHKYHFITPSSPLSLTHCTCELPKLISIRLRSKCIASLCDFALSRLQPVFRIFYYKPRSAIERRQSASLLLLPCFCNIHSMQLLILLYR